MPDPSKVFDGKTYYLKLIGKPGTPRKELERAAERGRKAGYLCRVVSHPLKKWNANRTALIDSDEVGYALYVRRKDAKKGRTEAKTDKQWTPQQIQAHRALMKASEKMGWNNYQAGLAAHVRAGRKKHTYRYTPTEEHERVIKASSDVLKGRITPEQAMAMLHEYDIFKQRMG